MTLVVVGLDAADYRLLREWELENLLLDSHRHLETFAYSRDTPLTSEVWPAIATGRLPEEDGDYGRRGSDWTGVMGLANWLANRLLPQEARMTIGRYLRGGLEVDSHYGPNNDDHLFGKGAVYNWPGVTPAQNWSRSEWWLQRFKDGELNDLEFLRRQLALTGEEIGWAATMAGTWLPIVGTRCHVLDHAGHSWARQPSKLETIYRRVDEMVGLLRESARVTDLVVCSDHGMQTTVLDDQEPGSHSWHSMVSTTLDGPLPTTVSEVRSWLEEFIPGTVPVDDDWLDTTMDTPVEHLRDLGYLQ